MALKFYPGQPGKIAAVASTVFSDLYLTKFQGFEVQSGWWSTFEAEFERDPHGPILPLDFSKS